MNKLTEKKILRAAKLCFKALKEQKLKEDLDISSLETAGEQFLARVEEINLPGDSEKDFQKLVDNGEFEMDVGENDLSSTGALSESVKTRRALKEGVGFGPALSHYKAQGGAQDFEAFKDWLTENGYGEEVLTGINKGNFNFRYKTSNAGGAKSAPIPEAPVKAADPSTYSSNLKDFIELCGEGGKIVMDAATSVEFKYQQIRSRLKRVILGKSMNRYYCLAGDPGIGKSYIVKETLDALGRTDVKQVKGSKGSSPAAVARFLIDNKDEDLVVLDDCDTFIDARTTSQEVKTMLKAAFDPDGHTVNIKPTLLNLIRKLKVEQDLRDKYKGNALFENEDVIEERIQNAIKESEEVEAEGEEEEDVPSKFDFNARIIFITNLTKADIDPAVLDRCEFYELHLTVDEFMIRLGKIINNMDCGQGTVYTEDEVNKAKGLVMAAMSAIIEASKTGATILDRTIRLVDGGLTFRYIKDLIENWIILTQDYMEEHGVDWETAKRACFSRWVQQYIFPKICR